MILQTFILSWLFLASASSDEEPSYVTCGEENSGNVDGVITSTVDRLMELRRPSWGWSNTPEVVLGIQLSAQEKFFARDKAIEQMKTELKNEIKSMNIGKLALYALAVKASCLDPRNFAGKDLMQILDRRSKQQFYYNGSKQITPFDRYYRFGLTLGALCVNNRPAKNWIIRKTLRGQNEDGSFGDVHSVDSSAQMLLALACVKTEGRPPDLHRMVVKVVEKLVTFLKSKVADVGSNVWIGNKFSSPHSALALMEEDEGPSDAWRCKDVMEGLAVNPQLRESEGAFSQRLPALAGMSYLELRSSDWVCDDPVSIPVGYQPTCTANDPLSCNPNLVTSAPKKMITVILTIYTLPPPSVGGTPSANVTVKVENGSTLYDVMVVARNNGWIRFESRTTSWGQSIRSMQGVEADSQARQYWSLIDADTQQPLSRGVSSYVPEDGEQIDFRRKTW